MSGKKKSNTQQQPIAVGVRIPTSLYGTVVPLLQGRTRLSPKIIFTGNFKVHQSGGKKQSKKGGNSVTYSANFDQLLGYGPLATIGSIWGNKSEYWPMVVESSVITLSGTGSDFSGSLPGSLSGGHWVLPSGDVAIQIICIALNRTITAAFNDFGGSGPVSVSGAQWKPLYNANATPLFVLAPGQGFDYCTYSRVSPTTQSFTLHVEPAMTNPQVTVYYLVIPNSYTTIDGTAVTNNVSNWMHNGPPTYLQVEEQLGNGSEFSYSGGSAFQIIYPEFFGIGLENLDMGASSTPPLYSYEGVAYHHFSPAGDCNPADHLLALITAGNFWPYTPSNSMWAHGLGFLPQNQSSDITTQVNILDDPPVPYPGVRTGGGAAYSLGLMALRNYCQAYGIFTSMYCDTQKPAKDWINDLADVANFVVVWTGSQLKFIPRCEVSATGNGAVYAAPTASGPVYDIGDGDYNITGSNDPITIVRDDRRALPNVQPVQHQNRASGYYESIVTTYKDQSQISLWGSIPASTKNWPQIQEAAIALKCAAPVLKHAQMIDPIKYNFKLGVRHCLADLYDLLTVDDPNLFAPTVVPGVVSNALSVNPIAGGSLSFQFGGWCIDNKRGIIYSSQYRLVGGTLNQAITRITLSNSVLAYAYIDPLVKWSMATPAAMLADPVDGTVLIQGTISGVTTCIKYNWDTDTVVATSTAVRVPPSGGTIQHEVSIVDECYWDETNHQIVSAHDFSIVSVVNLVAYGTWAFSGTLRGAPRLHRLLASYPTYPTPGPGQTAILDINNQAPAGLHTLVDGGATGNLTSYGTGIQFSPNGKYGVAVLGGSSGFVDFFKIVGMVPTLIAHVTFAGPVARDVVIDRRNMAYIRTGGGVSGGVAVSMYDVTTGNLVGPVLTFALTSNLNSGMGILYHPTEGQYLVMQGDAYFQAIKLPVQQAEKRPVRLTSMKEDENYVITCEAEPFVYGAHAPTLQTPESATPTGGPPTTMPIATLVNTPIIFEPIPALSGGAPQIWIGVSNTDPSYGGCAVYMSTDGGTSYELLGVMFGQSTMGASITSAFPSHTDPDGADTLHLDLAESSETMVDYSNSQRDVFVPLCYINGGGTVIVNGKSMTVPYELISYATANFVSGFKYDIVPTTRRGVYSTPNVSHPVASPFLYLGPGANFFKMQLPTSLIGTALKFKFAAFNQFAANQQDYTTCTAYSFTPTGLGQGSSVTASYTLNPNPVLYQGKAGGYPLYPSFTDPTKLYIVPFTATWSDGVTANYTPASPSTISGSLPETLYVTIYDPGRTGTGALYIDTTNARATQAGYVSLGSILITSTSTGGGTGTGGGGASAGPFDVTFFYNGLPTVALELLRIPVDGTVVLPVNLTGSQAVCETAPTGSVVLSIVWTPAAGGGPTTIGTINFAAGQTVATFTFAAAVTLNPGDILTIVAPAIADATFATIGGMLSATR